MNDPVYQRTHCLCFNITQPRQIAVVRLQRSLPFKRFICTSWSAFCLLFDFDAPLPLSLCPPHLSVSSGLIKAIVVLLLQYHVRRYQHTKPSLAEAEERGGGDWRSSYSHPTPSCSSSSPSRSNISLACPSQHPNSSAPLITNHQPIHLSSPLSLKPPGCIIYLSLCYC